MADHATIEKPEGLTAERAKAIATFAGTLLVSVNTLLSATGHNPLPFSDTEVYTAVSGVLTFGLYVYSWFKNQNMSAAAVQGSQVTKALKAVPSTKESDPAANADEGGEESANG